MKKVIAALGPNGTNGHLAALKMMGRYVKDGELLFCRRNVDIITAVFSGSADYGVVPVENCTEGPVREVIDYWLGPNTAKIQVVGEYSLPILHCLLVKPGVTTINSVLSHPQALKQCRKKLDGLGLENLKEVSSTALAAEMVAVSKEVDGVAAIASKEAAKMYGLKVFKPNVQDFSGNTTRFYLIGKEPAKISGNDRTAIIFQVKHQPGQLHLITGLMKIGSSFINMQSIHSIPLGTKNKVAFYVELDGHRDGDGVKQVLKDLRRDTERLIVLGSFPKHDW